MPASPHQCRSEPQMPTAVTRTRLIPGPATGSGSSATLRSPTACSLAARTRSSSRRRHVIFIPNGRLYRFRAGSALRRADKTAKPVIPGGGRGSLARTGQAAGCPPLRGADVALSYAAGPFARVTVVVCDWPDWSSQLIETLTPGWCLTRICWMSVAEETVWPSTEVIVSPSVRPALAAGEPDRAPAMVTPLLVPLPLPLVPLPSP